MKILADALLLQKSYCIQAKVECLTKNSNSFFLFDENNLCTTNSIFNYYFQICIFYISYEFFNGGQIIGFLFKGICREVFWKTALSFLINFLCLFLSFSVSDAIIHNAILLSQKLGYPLWVFFLSYNEFLPYVKWSSLSLMSLLELGSPSFPACINKINSLSPVFKLRAHSSNAGSGSLLT